MKSSLTKHLVLLAGILLLIGCSTSKTLYQWEGYQTQTLEYLKNNDNYANQIIQLEKGLEKIKSSGKNPPPGYHGFLGMLYGKNGQEDLMLGEFRREQALYPESKNYFDFLLRNYEK